MDGQWQLCRGAQSIDICDPFTGQVFQQLPAGGAADVDVAVAAARVALEDSRWANLSAAERSILLNRLADLVERRVDEIAAIETRDVGMPAHIARLTIQVAIAALRHSAALARLLTNRTIEGGDVDYHVYTRREPVGVVGIITPWNGPFVLLCNKIGAALAAGCPCVIKPPELAPISSIYLMSLISEAGIPPGVVNLVVGTGVEAGEALARHPDVRKVSFTGSTRTGQHLIRLAAEDLTRLTLELGGKSPLIIMNDADLDRAVPTAAWAVFGNSGQACYAASRLYVQETIYQPFLERLVEFTRSLKLGDPSDAQTDLGPLISREHRDRVAGRVEAERRGGGTIVVGGTPAPGNGFGYYPTIIADAAPDSEVMQDEIFGPVLCVSPFRSLDDALREANNSKYGLAAGIFTSNISDGHHAARSIRAGTVWINCYAHVDPSQPFGGYGLSGWGREFGPDALEPFLEVKSVQVKLNRASH